MSIVNIGKLRPRESVANLLAVLVEQGMSSREAQGFVDGEGLLFSYPVGEYTAEELESIIQHMQSHPPAKQNHSMEVDDG